MWDRLLVDCNIATFEESPGNPLGLVENGAIGIADGKIVRVGKRTELAGFRAGQVDALGGAWVTPGLIDCHTHLVFGGTRADEHAMRRAGAASRVVRLELVRNANGWHVTGEQDGAGDTRIAGPNAPSPADALAAWLRSPQAASVFGITTAPMLRLPSPNVLALQGAAELARRAGHYDAALATLQQAAALDRDDATLSISVADVAQAVGEDDIALDAIDRAQRTASTLPSPMRA